jgi:hypothetical protein
MAATLNALKKAPIIDANAHQLSGDDVSVVSSDPTVARVSGGGLGNPLWAVGVAAGAATLTATRHVDNAIATLDVTVIAAAPFVIALGAEQPA